MPRAELSRLVTTLRLDARPAPTLTQDHLSLAPSAQKPTPVDELPSSADRGADLETAKTLSDAVELWHAWWETAGLFPVVMYGEAPPERADACRIAARAVCVIAKRAGEAIDRAIDAADRAASNPPGAADPGLEQDIASLIHSRDVLLPLRAARAMLLLSALEPDRAIRESLAKAALTLATSSRGEAPWAQNERDLLLAAAQSRLEQGDAALETVGRVFKRIADPNVDPSLRRAVEAEAALIEALAAAQARGPVGAAEILRSRLDGPAFAPGNAPRPLALGLAAADVLLRLAPREMKELHDESGRQRAQARAQRAYEPLLERRSWPERLYIYQHLGRQTSPRQLSAQSPAVGVVAASFRALSEGRPDDAATILEQRVTLERLVLESVGADGAYLLLRASVESTDRERLRRAIALGHTLAEHEPEDPRSPEALALAARAADRHFRETPPGEPAEESFERLLYALRRVHLSTLEIPDRDAWRVTLAGMLAGVAEQPGLNDARVTASECSWLAESIQDPSKRIEAQVFAARAWTAALRAAQFEQSPTTTDLARQLLASCDPTIIDAAGARGGPARLEMAARRATALVALGRAADALTEVEAVAASEDAVPEVRDLALRAQAEAYLDLGREHEARESLARFAGSRVEAVALLAERSDRAWRAMEQRTRGFIAGEPAADLNAQQAARVFRLAADLHREQARSMERARLGWALLLAGDPDRALEAFDAASAEGESPSLLRGTAEARLARGDDEGAFSEFRRLAQTMEASGDTSRDYWHAWTRMLEILARRPRDPDSGASVRREIARLRSLPSALDHLDCLVKLREVEQRLSTSDTQNR